MMMRKLTTNKTKKKEQEGIIIINETGKLAKKMRFSQNGDHSQEDLAKLAIIHKKI
jgi:ATP-dependent protease HslVU (ClpYQ) ATPase subunit